jgi:hypothetical protein
MSTKVEKYIREDGMVGVLVSPGYGAGWSTWARPAEEEAMLFDKRIVQAVLDEKSEEEIVAISNEVAPESYKGGAEQLEVEWVTPSTFFEIQEYDGNESLRYFGQIDFHVA